MKINLDCIPCFQRQALESLRMNTQDEKLQETVLRKVMETLLKTDWSNTPLEIAYRVHKIVREETGIIIPGSVVSGRLTTAEIFADPDWGPAAE